MRYQSLAVPVLSVAALVACQDSPVAAPESDPASHVQVIRPEEYAKYGISPIHLPARPRMSKAAPGDAQANAEASIDWYSVSGYNGVVNGNDQLQLISVQNGFSGISYHSLNTTFYLQPGCTGSYLVQGGDSYSSSNGSPVGLISQRTMTWPNSQVNYGLVTATHYFQAASGYTVGGGSTATYYSSAGECH